MTTRTTILPPTSQFVTRWSPRAFDPMFVLPESDLLLCLEAARWSYSQSNGQSWRFVYGLKGDTTFPIILENMEQYNEVWAKNAAALVLVCSKNVWENEQNSPKPGHLFDTGAAAMSFSLQAQELGLVTHPMSGFNQETMRTAFSIPEQFTAHAVLVVGKMGDATTDLDAYNQAREQPSGRKSLDEIAKNWFDFS
jgi:nitroreductase